MLFVTYGAVVNEGKLMPIVWAVGARLHVAVSVGADGEWTTSESRHNCLDTVIMIMSFDVPLFVANSCRIGSCTEVMILEII